MQVPGLQLLCRPAMHSMSGHAEGAAQLLVCVQEKPASAAKPVRRRLGLAKRAAPSAHAAGKQKQPTSPARQAASGADEDADDDNDDGADSEGAGGDTGESEESFQPAAAAKKGSKKPAPKPSQPRRAPTTRTRAAAKAKVSCGTLSASLWLWLDDQPQAYGTAGAPNSCGCYLRCKLCQPSACDFEGKIGMSLEQRPSTAQQST